MAQSSLRFAVMTAFAVEDWHSQRILEALGSYGEVVAVDPAELSIQISPEQVSVGAAGLELSEFDLVALVRGMSPRGDPDAQFLAYRVLEDLGVPVVNRLQALLDAQDKFHTSVLLWRAGIPTPPAALAQRPEDAERFAAAIGQAVIKPVAGSLGEGVERLPPGAEGWRRAADRAEQDKAIYLQRWVEHPGRDVRVFVVGNQAIAAVERRAAPGEFRTNIARGGRPTAVTLTPELARIAAGSAAALGLDYTGVDIVEGPQGPQVIEVNGNPAFDMIYHASGRDMALELARHFARRAAEGRASRQQGPRIEGQQAPQGRQQGAQL